MSDQYQGPRLPKQLAKLNKESVTTYAHVLGKICSTTFYPLIKKEEEKYHVIFKVRHLGQVGVSIGLDWVLKMGRRGV